MRLPLLISLSLLLLAGSNAGAQLAPADDFFHSGAQFYISNNVAQAKSVVEMGRKLYPDDEKLKKLEELLKQQQQQQQQQSQQNQQQQAQQQKSQDQKDQPKQDQKASPQKSEDQQKAEEQKQKQADQPQKEAEKQADQKKAAAEKKDGEKAEDQPDEVQPVAPGQMTKEEAKRLLDAQKGNEQFLQLKPTDKPRDPRRPVKDW